MTTKNITLTLDDCRRLTGKNLLWDKPGTILDAFVSGIGKQHVIDVWADHVSTLLDGLNWQTEQTCSRIFEDGVTLAISAPMDALYAACEINEAAWSLTCDQLQGTNCADPINVIINNINENINDEVAPQLLTLMALADKHNAYCLVDDDDFSLGYGKTAQVWPMDNLPNPDEINWSLFKGIPLALVTGTNGKSTSVRLMSQIVEAAGKNCGVTSTDFIRVGDNILDYGDYSGPGGARMLLRHPDAQAGILEVARGGILRRGLPIDNVDAALITNIAEEHLGQYGINTVEAMAQAKAVVAKALTSGSLVLNADDKHLVALSDSLTVKKVWFSRNEDSSEIQEHLKKSGAVCFVRNDTIVYCDEAGVESDIVAINDVPMTLNGAAKHNVENALGVVGLAKSLGFECEQIAQALRTFSSNIDDNPGRGNQFVINGAKLIMDFAHNLHSMDAMASTTANMPAKTKYLMLSHAGDRTDREIINMSKSALSMNPDVLVIAELADYLRGRELGDIPKMVTKLALEHGLLPQNIIVVGSPVEGTEYIINQLEKDDLVLLMALSQRNQVGEILKLHS